MSEPLNLNPISGRPLVPVVITLRAAHGITPPDNGLVNIHFARREHGGRSFVTYARIADVPKGMEGRAITVWALAHPWRLTSIVRMICAYTRMRAAQAGRR